MSVKWKVSTTQTVETKWRDQDLQTAEISLTTNTSTKITTGSATMKHRMGLAKINMKTWSNVKNVLFYIAAPAAVKDVNYTWDNQAYTNVTSSSTYTSTAKPWQNTTHWYVMDANTEFTTSATTTGVASYSGQGVASATAADVRNNNSWTTTLTYTSGNCVEYTPTITATEFLSKVPYTLALGDVFYSNGAVSKPTSKFTSLTAIGILAYIAKDAYTEQSYGGGHALVISKFDDSQTRQWKTSNTESSLPNIESTMLSVINEASGYTNCHTYLNSTTYPAAYYAMRHSLEYPSSKCTGWFLPTMGQWYIVFRNLGQMSSTTFDESGSNDQVAGSLSIITNINNKLSVLGTNGTDYHSVKYSTSASLRYWTSTEHTDNRAQDWGWLYNYSPPGINIGSDPNNKTWAQYVRPFLAF